MPGYSSFVSSLDPNMRVGLGIATGALAGAPIGIIGALIKRKMDNSMAIQSATETTNLPMFQRPEIAPKKKVKKPEPETKPAEKEAFDPTVAQVGGAAGAALGTYTLLNKLFQRKDQRHLDMQLKNKEDRLNELLLHEQSLAAGIPKLSMALVKRSAEINVTMAALEKLAGSIYDNFEKTGVWDMPMSKVLQHVKELLALDQAGSALAVPSSGAGALLGFTKAREADPNTAKAKAVKDALRERLTGKDNMIGPMPIRVESDRPEMRPIRPGSSSLVDPSKGRDVLDGI